ncbi:MAG: hypothetical protein GX358_09175 [candidate division WS1 bacterium]|nr:hypothetical protein [candidate division WS1 bacterium]
MRAIRQIPGSVIAVVVIALIAIVAVAGGVLHGRGHPEHVDDGYDGQLHDGVASDTSGIPVDNPDSDAEAQLHRTPGRPGTVTDDGAAISGSADDAEQLDASGQIGEERYINLCVEMVIAAIGFQNAGQGHEELADYLPELLDSEGVTMEAFEEATEVISSNPRQAERVAEQIIERVEQRIGTRMDMRVLPMLNPAMGAEGG